MKDTRSKIALLDTSFSSLPLINCINTNKSKLFVVGGKKDDYLCNLSNAEYIQLDYRYTEKLNEFVKDFEIDYVVPGCNDVSFESYENLSKSDRVNATSFNDINNKKKFRQICRRLGLPAPKTYNNVNELASNDIIVKPEIGFSGKGVAIIKSTDHPQKIDQAIKNAEANSANGRAILEDFITGSLFSIGVFIKNNKVTSSFVVKEYCLTSKFTVDWSYISTTFSEKINNLFGDLVSSMPHLLGINNGHISLQCIIDEEDQIVIIEATFRCPGDLYPMLIELQTGVSYSYEYLSTFLPENVLKHTTELPNDGIVVRHTTTSYKENSFLGFQHRGLNTIFSVPTLKVGDRNSSKNKYRTGVHFYNMFEEPTLTELERLNQENVEISPLGCD